MRWLSIVSSGSPRLALRDVEIAGVTIRRGDLVVFNLPAANRDPSVVDDPERFDITRSTHRGPAARRLRPRGAPLPRRAARPHGDAERLPVAW